VQRACGARCIFTNAVAFAVDVFMHTFQLRIRDCFCTRRPLPTAVSGFEGKIRFCHAFLSDVVFGIIHDNNGMSVFFFTEAVKFY